MSTQQLQAAQQSAPAAPAAGGKSRAEKAEDWFVLGVLLGIMAVSLFASFTHMHDWTMKLMPKGTGDWFGWVNAVISELVPLVSTLKLRKRIHDGGSLWKSYALYILLGSVMLSLAAQLSAVPAEASSTAKFLACLPAIAVLVLSKLVIGDLDAGRKAALSQAEQAEIAAAQAAQQAATLRAARAETEQARRELAEIQARLDTETERLQAEIAARTEAETRAEQVVQESEIQAVRHSEIRSEIESEIQRVRQSEIRAVEARRIAEQRADEQAQLARLAQGRLAEARETADRAQAARVAAEQTAAAHMQQVSTAAEQAEHALRQELAAATGAAAAADRRVAELAEQVRVVEAQREEARASAERQGTARVLAEQEIAALQRGRDAALDELEKVRRQLARVTERAEIGAARQPEISGRPARKSAAPAVMQLPENLPVVETVRPEKVAAVLVARVTYPDASQLQLAEITNISDRTIGKVLRAVPSEIAGEVAEQILALAGGGKVLALTDGRAA